MPLEEAEVYNGVPIPKGSYYRYGRDGKISSVVTFEKIKYKDIDFEKGSIKFNDNGIDVARLASDQKIDGIEYSASGIGPFFNEDGDVVNAVLAKDTEIAGIVYKGGGQITFHSKGRVKSGTVANEITVQGQSFIPGDYIGFRKDGGVTEDSRGRKSILGTLPERKEVIESSEFLGRTIVTDVPLAYQVNLPGYNEVSTFIRDNSATLFAKEVDRQITDFKNRCTGCLDQYKITTRVRMEYIPAGTSLNVTGEYLYKSNLEHGSTIHMLIIRDELGNSAEVSETDFRLFTANVDSSEDQRIGQIRDSIESFHENEKIRLSFCVSDFVQRRWLPEKFVKDFQMEDEVDVTFGITSCNRGYIFEFKTIEAYLTSVYYFESWGLYGKWSSRFTKLPPPPKPINLSTKPVTGPAGISKILACPPIEMTGINGPAHLSELCKEEWEAGLCCSGAR